MSRQSRGKVTKAAALATVALLGLSGCEGAMGWNDSEDRYSQSGRPVGQGYLCRSSAECLSPLVCRKLYGGISELTCEPTAKDGDPCIDGDPSIVDSIELKPVYHADWCTSGYCPNGLCEKGGASKSNGPGPVPQTSPQPSYGNLCRLGANECETPYECSRENPSRFWEEATCRGEASPPAPAPAAPQVIILSPQHGATVEKAFALKYKITSSAKLTKVEVKVGDKALSGVAQVTGEKSLEVTLDCSADCEQRLEVNAWVEDKSAGKTISVYYKQPASTDKPGVKILSPAAGAVEKTFTLKYKVTSSVSLTEVEVKVGDKALSDVAQAVGEQSLSVTLECTATCTKTLRVSATDDNGQTGSAQVTVKYEVAAEEPKPEAEKPSSADGTYGPPGQACRYSCLPAVCKDVDEKWMWWQNSDCSCHRNYASKVTGVDWNQANVNGEVFERPHGLCEHTLSTASVRSGSDTTDPNIVIIDESIEPAGCSVTASTPLDAGWSLGLLLGLLALARRRRS